MREPAGNDTVMFRVMRRHKGLITLFLLVTVVFVILSISPPASAADGTSGYWTDYASDVPPRLSDNTYTIRNAAQLAWIACQVNAGTTFEGYTFLISDKVTEIDLSAHYWVPIGYSDSRPFKGTFDGNNRTLSNIKIGDPGGLGASYYKIGLFGYINTATIRNIQIKDSLIYTSYNADIGGISGQSFNSVITNVNISGFISVNNLNANAGGVLGYVQSTRVENCTSTVCISGGLYTRVGGLIGNCQQSMIRSCSATGDYIGGCEVGCLMGFCYTSSITDCFAVGSASSDKEYCRVGGLIGYACYGTINNCYSIANTTGGSEVGGLVGFSSNNAIANCYAASNVTSARPTCWMGGLVGHAEKGSIANCYATGSQTILAPSGDLALGGLVGNSVAAAVTNSFWDSNSRQMISGAERDPMLRLGVGKGTDTTAIKTPEEMRTSQFVSLLNNAGSDIWAMDSIAANNGYPVLNSAAYCHLREELNESILFGSFYDPNVYSPTTANALISSKSEALAVWNTLSADKTRIDAATEAINTALNRAYLEDLLVIAKAEVQDDYLSDRWNALQGSITDAEALITGQNAINNDVIAAADRLFFSLYTLSAFDSLIEQSEQITAEQCSADTWLILQTALTAAKALQAAPYSDRPGLVAAHEALLAGRIRCLIDYDLVQAQWFISQGQDCYTSNVWNALNKVNTSVLTSLTAGSSMTLTDVEYYYYNLEYVCCLADTSYWIDYQKHLTEGNYSTAEWTNLQAALQAASSLIGAANVSLDQLKQADDTLWNMYRDVVFVFSDIMPTDPLYDSALLLYRLGIVELNSDGAFQPDRDMESELAYLIAQKLGKEPYPQGYNPITDADILDYYPNREFGATLEKCAYTILALMDADLSAVDADSVLNGFSDLSSISASCRDSVAYLVSMNIISSTSGGYLQPQKVVTRGEFAALYSNCLKSILPPAPTEDSDFVYIVMNGSAVITSYCGAGGNVVIPSTVTIGGTVYPVTEIADGENNNQGAFSSGKATITSIRIPDSVKIVGSYAFFGCTELTSVNIGNGVERIGSYAFYGCSKLASLSIPASVKYWGSGAFMYCTGLVSVTLESGLKCLGDSAFSGCSSLPAITIPDSILEIATGAFNGCTSLSSVKIGNGVTSIGNSAFVYNKALKSIDIPDNVRTIDNSAFTGSGLVTITVPDSVTRIGSSAFQNCMDLTSATIGDNVTVIGSCAFANCPVLSCIQLGDALQTLEDSVFGSCIALKSITIPSHVLTIGNNVFRYCTNLSGAYFLGTKPAVFGSDVFGETAPGFAVYYNRSLPTSWEYFTLYTKKPYTCLVLNGNKGVYNGAVDNIIFTDLNASEDISEYVYTRNEFELTGWNTKPDGTGTQYAASQLIQISGDLTLYAQWSRTSPVFSVTPSREEGSFTCAVSMLQNTVSVSLSIDSLSSSVPAAEGVWVCFALYQDGRLVAIVFQRHNSTEEGLLDTAIMQFPSNYQPDECRVFILDSSSFSPADDPFICSFE